MALVGPAPGPGHQARSVHRGGKVCDERRREKVLQVRGGRTPEEPDSLCVGAAGKGRAERAE